MITTVYTHELQIGDIFDGKIIAYIGKPTVENGTYHIIFEGGESMFPRHNDEFLVTVDRLILRA